MNIILLKGYLNELVSVDFLDKNNDPKFENGKMVDYNETESYIVIKSITTMTKIYSKDIQKIHIKKKKQDSLFNTFIMF